MAKKTSENIHRFEFDKCVSSGLKPSIWLEKVNVEAVTVQLFIASHSSTDRNQQK